MDLNVLLRVLRRRIWILVVVAVACVAGAAAAAWLQEPVYGTTATLVATTGSAATTPAGGSALTTAERATSLARFANSAPVASEATTLAGQALGVAPHPPESVSVQSDGVSPFLAVSVSDPDPRWAQAVANAYVDALPRALAPIDPGVAASAQQLSVLTAAGLPGAPTSPDKTQYLLLGLLLGVVLGVGVAVGLEALDQQVRDPDDLTRALGLPVLGAVPQSNPKQALPVQSAPHSPRSEAYRAVQANLVFGSAAGLPPSLLVTSPSVGDGVSTVAANVALALARSGRRVILVDANLRTPRQHDLFDLPVGPGLADVLLGAGLDEAISTIPATSLRVLPAGRPSGDPAERLTGPRAAEVIQALGRGGDVVIIDGPPVLPVADSLFLASHASAVLLVARAEVTTTPRLRQARDALQRVNADVLGVVLNGVSDSRERLPPRRRHGPADADPAAGDAPAVGPAASSVD